mmetsp:Transcript_12608/g.28581  ORF Transcript_12608/g.28581 Transcript_12608/m.28581 type:complete len:1015 (-) Transcript_12608:65-3109(-)
MGNGAGVAPGRERGFEQGLSVPAQTMGSRGETTATLRERGVSAMKTSPVNSVSSNQEAASSLIGVANSCLESKHATAIEAVEELVAAAGMECGGEAYFYSAPGGRGRACVRRSSALADTSKAFLLVCASGGTAADAVHSEAPHEHTALLRRAVGLNGEAAVLGNYAACSVITDAGLEGILLVERPPRINSTVAPPLALAVRLWALVLAERLAKLVWRQESKETEQALESLLNAMERMVGNDIDELEETVAMMVPQQLASSLIQSERVALWTLDQAAQELVLNNSGHFDGNRVSVHGTVMGEALQDKEGHVLLSMEPDPQHKGDEPQFNARTSLLVPVTQAKAEKPPDDSEMDYEEVRVDQFEQIDKNEDYNFDSAGFEKEKTDGVQESEEKGIQVVLQFKRKPDGTGHTKPITHFDLVGAEALQRSVLPIVLSARDCFMQFLATKRQRANVQNVTQRLSRASTVTEMARLIEQEVAGAMHCETCSLWFLDDDHDEVWAPPTETLPRGIRLKIGDGIVGNWASRAKTTGLDEVDVVNDPPSCSLWKGDQSAEFVTRNIMTAPVWSGSGNQRRLIALIQILNKCSTFGGQQLHESLVTFTQTDVQLLQRLAQAVGEHLRQLLLDIMWTKTRMDTTCDGGSVEQSPEIVQEYYSREFARHHQGSIRTVVRGTSLKAGHGPHSGPHHNLRASTIARIAEEEEFHDDSYLTGIYALESWTVDYWALTRPEDFRLFLRAMQQFDIITDITLDMEVLARFFQQIQASYREVPYHNFFHALATIHYVYKLVCAAGAKEYLTTLDLFSLLIAALCHDCDHRGKNNAFEVLTQSELALRYNDSSPLENHHCARAFEIALCGDACDVFDVLSSEQYSVARGRIVAGILSTDMKCHGHHVELVQNFELRQGSHNSQSQFLVELFLHTADIGNPLMPQQVAERWGKALADEFSAQVEAEESRGIPVTTFMQGWNRPHVFAKSQMSFIDLVLAPLVSPLCRTFTGLLEVKEFMDQNREKHAKLVESLR